MKRAGPSLFVGTAILLAGCGGNHERRRDLGTTALCNNNTFTFETHCSEICRAPGENGVKEWYVNCGQTGQGPTSPLP